MGHARAPNLGIELLRVEILLAILGFKVEQTTPKAKTADPSSLNRLPLNTHTLDPEALFWFVGFQKSELRGSGGF